jgi:hypothetical protein
MHTAICTFEDRSLAEQAVDRLVQAGFSRRDIHMEQRHPDGSPMEERRDHDVVGKFSFFERLFGAGKHAPHAETYHSALERGLYVVLVEHQEEAEAERAQNVLHGMEARDLNLVHRAGQPPLREVVGERPAPERSLAEPDETRRESERAIASQGWGEQRSLEVVDDDKPIASPSIPAEREHKPR